MQDLENNMDELFQKAAANYPLKTGKSRWDEIAAAVTAKNTAVAKKKNNRRRYSALILLLAIGLLLGGGLIINTAIRNKITGSKNVTIAKMTNDIPGENKNVVNHLKETVVNDQELKRSKSELPQYSGRLLIIKSIIQPGFFVNGFRAGDDHLVLQEINTKVNQADIQLKSGEMKNNNDSENNLLSNTDEGIKNINEQEKSMDDKKTETPENGSQPQKNKGFYYGFAAGPAFSEVKSQSIRKIGFDAGVLAGYQINNNFSIETGLMFSKKYYHSDGKYFNMSKMPASMKVLSLEGNSDLLEIPVKIRYKIKAVNKNHVSISAGISTYILTKEKNDYLLLVNGSQQNMTSIYKTAHSYMGASLNLSAGYERKINKFSTVRIEPYLKIPLKGIGVGSMQVMSTGLQIAVTRQSH